MKKEIVKSPGNYCPIRKTIKLLGKRWTILIIKEIFYCEGRRLGFMDLRKRLMDVSTKVLSERLREMTRDGLIKRKVKADASPIRVYYSLTPKGKDVCDIIMDLKKYGLKWYGKGTAKCDNIDCELCARDREQTVI